MGTRNKSAAPILGRGYILSIDTMVVVLGAMNDRESISRHCGSRCSGGGGGGGGVN